MDMRPFIVKRFPIFVRLAGALRGRHVLVILAGITAWGFVLRVYSGGSQSLWVDEATSISAALAILEDGTPSLLSEVSYWRSPIHSYLMAVAMAAGGASEFAARLPSMVLGTATIPMAFLFGRRLLGTGPALVLAALIAFADAEIGWSRQARMYQHLQFFSLLTLYFYMSVLDRHTWLRIVATLTGVVAVVSTHPIGLAIPVAMATHWGVVRTVDALRSVTPLRSTMRLIHLYPIVGLLLLLLVTELFTGEISRTWRQSSSGFLWLYSDYYRATFGIVYYLGIAGLVLRFYDRPRESMLYAVLVAGAVYVLAFHANIVAFRFLYFILPLLFLGFVSFLDSAPRLFGLARVRIIPLVLIAAGVGFAAATGPYTVIPKAHYYLGTTSPQPDFKAAYRAFGNELQPGDTLIDAWPAVASFYLGRAPDYWPMISIDSVTPSSCPLDGGTREIYGNSLCLGTAAELSSVVARNARGWVVLDDIAWHRLPKELRRAIEVTLRPYPIASSSGAPLEMHVFRWE